MSVPDETQILGREPHPGGNWLTNSAGYQTLLVLLLSLNFGIVFFDRQALNVLMPFVQPDLALSNTQIGLLAGGLSFSWAIAAFFVGRLSDTLGKRKILLVIATIAFSLCSFLSGLATSFLFLFAARLLMGAAEGGVMPISHAMVASEVDPERRGLAQGVAQNLGSNLLGSFAAPVVLVAFATMFSWREAFYLAALPGLLSAAMIWFMLREPKAAPKKEGKPVSARAVLMEILYLILLPVVIIYVGFWLLFTPKDHPQKSVPADRQFLSMLEALKIPNMWITVVVGIMMVAHFVITWAFMPVFLVQARGMDATSMSWLVGSLGIAAAIYSFLVSGASDKIGRKPVMVFLPFLSLVGPLGVLLLDPADFAGTGAFGLSNYAMVLIPIFFIGWMVNGTFPIFMATIPSETFRPLLHATVLGLAMGACEVLGGVFGPPIAGMLNDAFGVESFLYVLMVLAVISGFVSMGLRETAPAVLRRRGLPAAVAP